MTECCSQILNPLRPQREGTSQDARRNPALDPGSAPADARTLADHIVFVSNYATQLNYFDANNVANGDWSKLFASDPVVPLATASVENPAGYQQQLTDWLAVLDSMDNKNKLLLLRDTLGILFSATASLAVALDRFKHGLPNDSQLKASLSALISGKLSPALQRLIAYQKAGVAANLLNDVVPAPKLRLLGVDAVKFADLLSGAMSKEWSGAADWPAFAAGIAADASVYGPAGTIFTQINHCATHNLFRGAMDEFQRAYAYTITEATAALSVALTTDNGHAPHYALTLAVTRLLGLLQKQGNHLTQRHLDFYFRTILGLAETPSAPGRAHLVAELGKQVKSHRFETGTLFKAGKDAIGKDAAFSASADTIANQAKVVALQSLYRHGEEKVDNADVHKGRLFASAFAASADGFGEPLTPPEMSWHPFFNKTYVEGELKGIAMLEAKIGFAIASHHLLMSEGKRTVVLTLAVSQPSGPLLSGDFTKDVRCYLTTEEGWLEKPVVSFTADGANSLELQVTLTGGDPATTPYEAAVHARAFDTNLPILMIELKHDATRPYAYAALKSLVVESFTLQVLVEGLKSLAVSNDFGPVDTSKPFQPWGSDPIAKSSLTIGSKEIFQKPLSVLLVLVDWQIAPPSGGPNVNYKFLQDGSWQDGATPASPANSPVFWVDGAINETVVDAPDFNPDEGFGTTSQHGFFRLELAGDIGQSAYRTALETYLSTKPLTGAPPQPPSIPTAAGLTIIYLSEASTDLMSAGATGFASRSARFFHVLPFGVAEQHPALFDAAPVTLLPRFAAAQGGTVLDSEGELYIGVSGLQTPQDISLLFQVADGTANPLALKPAPHLRWSYLSDNRWIAFEATSIQDGTRELLDAGLVRLSVPRASTDTNTLLPAGLRWLRVSVSEKPDAVCRLQLVAAQALETVFVDRDNDPAFSAAPLPAGSVSKLLAPVAAVKSLNQPFASFGGRGAEDAQAFYIRASERLRHKDRTITAWDYEHLVLGAFPQIYKLRCLNHTRYEPSESSDGIYNELAAGHVTLVAIPRMQPGSSRDPLKPYASLGLLQEIESYLARRASCFARIHVRNPQFEDIRVTLKVRFFDGFDETFYTRHLQQAITRFLSPWAFSGGGPSFGGKVYKSAVVNFIEDQSYVDYLTDVCMFHDIKGKEGTTDLFEAEGSLAVSLLVSAPAQKHRITVLHPSLQATAVDTCGCSP